MAHRGGERQALCGGTIRNDVKFAGQHDGESEERHRSSGLHAHLVRDCEQRRDLDDEYPQSAV